MTNKDSRPAKRTLLPAGIDNFHELITHQNTEGSKYLFVDKTLFIKEFMDNDEKITLITRPRRFGKTLTLSMVEHFFANEVNGVATKGLFDSLAISRHPEVMQYQGQHPVIFLTLKEVRGGSSGEFLGALQNAIKNLYAKHMALLSSKELAPHNLRIYDAILNKKASLEDYKESLCLLSQLLYKHTGKKVVILVDEYDTPIHDAFIHGYYKECTRLLAAMFGEAFKGNDALKKGLITGILKVSKASLFS